MFGNFLAIEDRVYEELEEEAGISRELVETIQIGKVFNKIDSDIDKTWVTVSVLAKLNYKPEIKLNWEHTEYKWIEENKALDFAPWLEEEVRNIYGKNI